MRLKVPHYRQEKRLTCGLAVLRMVFVYFGEYVSEKEILNKITLHNFGSFTTDLGVVALRMGYKVTVFTFHLPLVAPLNLPFGSEIRISQLDKLKVRPKDKKTFESWTKYLKSGGKMYWDVPKISQIEYWLKRKTPCLISVNTAALNKYYKNWDNGHFLLINGFENNDILYLDPDVSEEKANKKIAKDVLLPSWSINSRSSSGYLMVIEKC